VAKKASRRRYTAAEKKKILETAVKEGLTGAQVQKRFGIAQLTFYRWRGPVRGPKARAAAAAAAVRGITAPAGLATAGARLDAIRAEVRAGIRQVLPGVIREEVSNYLAEILGGAPVKRGPGRPRGSRNRRRVGRPKKK
jgi:transposase-like protein